MGFNSVYRSLQEVFPQVDARLLKAVAIEHSKDADTAVEVVLSEVLPYISKQPISRGENQEIGVTSDGGVESEEQIIMLKRQQVAEEATAGSSSKPDSIARENANDTDNAINAHPINSICPEEAAPNGSSVLNSSDLNDGHEQVCVSIESDVSMPQEKGQEVNAEVGPDNTAAGMPLEKGQEVNAEVEPDKTAAGTSITLMQEDGANDDRGLLFGNFSSEELISFGKCQETCVNVVCDQISNVTPTTLFHEGRGVADSSNDLRADWEDFDWPVAIDLNTVALGKSHQEVSSLDSTSLTVGDSVAQLVPSSVQEHAPDAQDCVLQLEINSGTSITDCEKPETSGSSDPTFKQGNSVGELVDFEDESTLNALVTRSGQICRIDLLEDIIEDAKDNKKTLFSAMESVINMMREVEVKEKAVEQAKGEAARGGLDILIKVEELKRMLGHAKEANDMHAGEVYGEKSILATEARELQSRLLCLSDERDKSLAILDEMHQTLEVRLAAAEDERKAAEQEKLEKEEVARRALAEQESIMETVVQESRILHEEAEENSKLREFLMDRGRIVDMLQGEISVICQDVRLLKQKFDERVPLSKSVSSSQTSCILASSSSSLKSMASIEQGETPEKPKKTSPAPSINGQSPKGSPTSSIDGRSPKSSPEEKRTSYDKALLDDGWDLFDNDAELYR